VEVDGHDMTSILKGMDAACAFTGGPAAVISRTKKGKGVSFMEQSVPWHSQAPSREQVLAALKELGADEEECKEWLT
jgi:transketolase